MRRKITIGYECPRQPFYNIYEHIIAYHQISIFKMIHF